MCTLKLKWDVSVGNKPYFLHKSQAGKPRCSTINKIQIIGIYIDFWILCSRKQWSKAAWAQTIYTLAKCHQEPLFVLVFQFREKQFHFWYLWELIPFFKHVPRPEIIVGRYMLSRTSTLPDTLYVVTKVLLSVRMGEGGLGGVIVTIRA